MKRLTYRDCLARLKNLETSPVTADKTDRRRPEGASVSSVSAIRGANEKIFDPLADPRADLAEDSHLWSRVLMAARETNLHVHAVLHGFRCMGARLVFDCRGLRMESRTHGGEDPQVFEFGSREHYQQLRTRWLLPITDEVTAIFRTAAKGLSR